MNKEEKILKTLADEKCFLVSETDRYKYYLCKGVSNNVYDIIYYKGLDRWKCNCDNIRTKNYCYHILTAKRLKENESRNDI